MKHFIHTKEALANLFSTKLRSLLALLGILVGTASVVAMVSGGQLATNQALKQFKTLGTDLLAVSISESEEQPGSGIQDNLTLDEANASITANKHILGVAPYSQAYGALQYEGHAVEGSVLGATEGLRDIAHIELASGRFISFLDGYEFFCVIGDNVYQALQKISLDNPIGKQLQVGANVFTIVGVAKNWPENSFLYANINYSVIVPILTSFALSKYSHIDNIIYRLAPNSNIDQVQQDLTTYFNQQVKNKRYFFRSAKQLIASMRKQSDILTIFLGLIGGISLLVGGIGVMNIMLVSVIERRREIGIRLAVGAKHSDIRTLFLIEAVILALIGGVMGVVLGVLTSYIVAILWKWTFTFFILPPLIGFTVSVFTGVFFGFYPAYQAAKLDPITALRSE